MRFIALVQVRVPNRYCWPKQDAEIVRWAIKGALSVLVPEGWGTHTQTVTRPVLRRKTS